MVSGTSTSLPLSAAAHPHVPAGSSPLHLIFFFFVYFLPFFTPFQVGERGNCPRGWVVGLFLVSRCVSAGFAALKSFTVLLLGSKLIPLPTPL